MKNKRCLLIILTTLLLFSLTGCGARETVKVNVNKEDIYGETLGVDSLIEIGSGLYYDSATRIVYWWNGCLRLSYFPTTPSAYYAPNGLPYRYNPETNTFEEIEVAK